MCESDLPVLSEHFVSKVLDALSQVPLPPHYLTSTPIHLQPVIHTRSFECTSPNTQILTNPDSVQSDSSFWGDTPDYPHSVISNASLYTEQDIRSPESDIIDTEITVAESSEQSLYPSTYSVKPGVTKVEPCCDTPENTTIDEDYVNDLGKQHITPGISTPITTHNHLSVIPTITGRVSEAIHNIVDLDSEVKCAYEEFQQSGSTLPMTKLNLRYFVQNRRCENGLPPVSYESVSKADNQLSENEINKRQLLRKHNKDSAKKYRQTKRNTQLAWEKELVTQTKENERLRNRLSIMQGEKTTILHRLRTECNIDLETH